MYESIALLYTWLLTKCIIQILKLIFIIFLLVQFPVVWLPKGLGLYHPGFNHKLSLCVYQIACPSWKCTKKEINLDRMYLYVVIRDIEYSVLYFQQQCIHWYVLLKYYTLPYRGGNPSNLIHINRLDFSYQTSDVNLTLRLHSFLDLLL